MKLDEGEGNEVFVPCGDLAAKLFCLPLVRGQGSVSGSEIVVLPFQRQISRRLLGTRALM